MIGSDYHGLPNSMEVASIRALLHFVQLMTDLVGLFRNLFPLSALKDLAGPMMHWVHLPQTPSCSMDKMLAHAE
ncbi:Auxin-responsive protein [Psidium guajava]|nr:Auxin-responsive protein [Psidium guajava]